jgi:hypothetical protein
LVFRDSLEVSFLLRSTAIPIDWAYCLLSPAAFISLRVNPLPSLIFPLYLLVCPLTTGLSE